jgi:hypothetical protein
MSGVSTKVSIQEISECLGKFCEKIKLYPKYCEFVELNECFGDLIKGTYGKSFRRVNELFVRLNILVSEMPTFFMPRMREDAVYILDNLKIYMIKNRTKYTDVADVVGFTDPCPVSELRCIHHELKQMIKVTELDSSFDTELNDLKKVELIFADILIKDKDGKSPTKEKMMEIYTKLHTIHSKLNPVDICDSNSKSEGKIQNLDVMHLVWKVAYFITDHNAYFSQNELESKEETKNESITFNHISRQEKTPECSAGYDCPNRLEGHRQHFSHQRKKCWMHENCEEISEIHFKKYTHPGEKDYDSTVI